MNKINTIVSDMNIDFYCSCLHSNPSIAENLFHGRDMALQQITSTWESTATMAVRSFVYYWDFSTDCLELITNVAITTDNQFIQLSCVTTLCIALIRCNHTSDEATIKSCLVAIREHLLNDDLRDSIDISVGDISS